VSPAGVPLTVGGEEIALLGFAMVTAVFSVVGIVLASALARWARRPQRTFVIATVALTALSLLPDASADASTATRHVLALTHVVAAAIVIPAVASRLAD
jgi:amino acid transporter